MAATAAMGQTGEEIVVTGSRIARPDYVANSPIVTVSTETFENTSTVGVESVLNQLPQFVPSLTEFDSRQLGATATTTPGASVIDLRGLGSFRSLTLVDGRRAQPFNATLSVDTNSIPSAAIERVEIISGGASAVYGADAVAGVVNFILKDDFQGMNVSSRWGQTEEGDGDQFQSSILVGTDFAEGKGNVMMGLEYAKRGTSYDYNREWIQEDLADPMRRAANGAVVTETYVDFGRNTNRPTTAAIASIFPTASLLSCTNPGNGLPCSSPGTTTKYFINRTPDGNGTLWTGGQAFGSDTGQRGLYRYAGYPGPEIDPVSGEVFRKVVGDGTLEENNLDTLTTVPLERYSMFAKAEYEFTDNVSAYLRANFAHTETRTVGGYNLAVNNWGAIIPVGFAGTVYQGDPANGIPSSLNGDGSTNAAYLPGGAYDLNCPTMGGCEISQAFPLPDELRTLLMSRPNPNADVEIHRVMDYLPRSQANTRTSVYQITAGLEGSLANDWKWDASYTFGQSDGVTNTIGLTDLIQYRALVASPNYGVAFKRSGPSPTTSGLGLCTSGLPLFRDFVPSQDCVDSISTDMQTNSTLKQMYGEVNLSGDLEQMFTLPAGAVSFAIGAHYREYEYDYINDHLNNFVTFANQTVGLAAQSNTKGAKMDTREIYGELLIPLVKDVAFMEELNLELGGRYSDWNTSGGVSTYKVLADWSVTPWMRLRGGYNRATRSPNIQEFFLGRTIAGQTLSGDPCSTRDTVLSYSANPTNGAAAQTEALCRALMTQAAATQYYGDPNLQSTGAVATTTLLSGSVNVQPETANTYTIGAVIRSPFDNAWLEGMTVTVDYYSIRIKDLIAQEDADEVWRKCIVSNSASSADCALVFRDPFDGRLTLPQVSYTNRGELKFSGVDIQFNWRGEFNDLGLSMIPGGMSINSQFTIPIDRRTQDAVDVDPVDYVGTDGCSPGLQCSGYKYQVFTTFNYFNGPLSLSLRWNHYPTIRDASYAVNPNTRIRGVFESYDVVALTGSYQFNDTVTIRAGIDNLLDTSPPLDGGDYAADGGFVNVNSPPTLPQAANESVDDRYDHLGRRFFVGLDLRF
ncbi:MAG: TonB-dependent receptor [Gammaproteobacteria bacterium]|nr:TonB-dependent receptor [Gammaproteobacteria bacterium]